MRRNVNIFSLIFFMLMLMLKISVLLLLNEDYHAGLCTVMQKSLLEILASSHTIILRHCYLSRYRVQTHLSGAMNPVGIVTIPEFSSLKSSYINAYCSIKKNADILNDHFLSIFNKHENVQHLPDLGLSYYSLVGLINVIKTLGIF